MSVTHALVLVGILVSCVTEKHNLGTEIDVAKNRKEEINSHHAAKEDLERFDELISSSSSLAPISRDIRAILLARSLGENGKGEQSLAAWKEATGTARGGLGRIAFDGWLKAYLNQLQRKVDPLVLARLVLGDTGLGGATPFLIRANLTTEQALAKFLDSYKSEWIEASTFSGEGDQREKSVALPSAGIPGNDPFLLQTAADYCRAANSKEEWQDWVQSLPSGVREYWLGISAKCSGRIGEAEENLAKAIELFSAPSTWSHLKVEAASQIVQIQRAQGSRQKVADSYLILMNAWSEALTAGLVKDGEDGVMLIRRVDDALWAGRNRALVGDLENAKIFCHQALEWIKSAGGEFADLPPKIQQELTDKKVEAYHTLAFRVAVERRELESAISLSVLALQTRNISKTWAERLKWDLGLYEFMRERYVEALGHWDGLANETITDSMRAKLLFWRSIANERLNKKEIATTLRQQLSKKYPLNYYSVVAGTLSVSPEALDWKANFGKWSSLVSDLDSGKRLSLNQKEILPDLVADFQRAEILVRLQVPDLRNSVLADLRARLEKEQTVTKNPDLAIYLTRLDLASGNYFQAISATGKLIANVPDLWAKWPEQVLVFFPLPFLSEMQEGAVQSKVELPLIAAIIRQESAFNPDAVSPANAFGLMQLIRPTANRLASESGVSEEDVRKRLTQPDINIRLGSSYLKQLSQRYAGGQAMVAAAYNAGEFAVDSWKDRRDFGDMLVWIELVPFGETQDYIKNVWRNLIIYRELGANSVGLASH